MTSRKRYFAAILAAAFLSAGIPAFPAHAEEPLALRISKVEVLPDSLDDDRLVSVDVQIEGNEHGFLAAEFGIAFDNRLTLQGIRSCCAAAERFSYSSTSENHMIWFSGCNVKASSGATDGKTQLFTLEFVLPEDYQVGDVFAIGYEWDGVDGSSGFWYSDKKQDVLTSLMSYSRTGSISIPSPDAPKLNKTALTLNQNSTYILSVQNASGEGIWFSDNDAVASVVNGVITANAPGNCVISVFLGDASSLLTCDVTVRNEYRYSMFDTEPVVITSKEQEVFLEYPNAVGSVIWVSTNPNVITVNDGQLTAHSNGTAQIIASNNGISKMKSVTVSLGAQTQPATAETTTAEPTTAEPVTESDAPPARKAGDVNGDSAVNILDVIVVNKYLVGSTKLKAAQQDAADIYHDGIVNSRDSLMLLKYVLDMLPGIPIEP